jgi:predicted SAM-dependent methyltransferase
MPEGELMAKRVNLGCGLDVKPGYENVDFRPTHPSVRKVDLSILPWPYFDDELEQVLMLDFLEHFPYRRTKSILLECWRVLKPNGELVVQVPDFIHCSRAMAWTGDFQCNVCGSRDHSDVGCKNCGASKISIQEAAVGRLYGGQDYEGNYHLTTFSEELLRAYLIESGFTDVTSLEVEHQHANWNVKLSCKKAEDLWTNV